ncbi:MAG TPA: hypothetical protein VEV17_10185 [Bryobacteraceae bacterium]|nr:hypothetical protein [Bryobacteraceae bacterium]
MVIHQKLPTILRAAASVVMAALMAVVAAGTAGAQTPNAQLVSRALSQDDMTYYSLSTTLERSGGLSTVGVGQAIYLEADLDNTIPASQIASVTWELTSKPAGSNAAFSDSPLGPNVPVYEPSDRVIFQVAGRTLLRADVPGQYLVKATITTVGAGTVTVSLALTASTYMGIGTCTGCHGIASSKPWSMVDYWQQTLHSQIFTQGMNGVASDHYAASCLGCHTVGYDTDPNAANGGFDDIAKQLGWVFPTPGPGVFDALPAALKNVGNVQCENCHGPGSSHVLSGGATMLISVSSDSGTCGQCHGAATHHPKSAEWGNSRHAITTRDPAGSAGCVGCHTGNGFVGKIAGDTTLDTSYSAISCQTCHEPHGATTPSNNTHLVRTLNPVTLADGTQITNAGMGTLCMNCHQARQNAAVYAAKTAGSSHFGPHHGPQADMLEGTNGFTYGQFIPSSAHADMVADTCVSCHMQTLDAADPALTFVGDHTFNVKFAGNDTVPAKEMVGACQGCHGPDVTTFNFPLMDYNGDGVIEGAQTEVQHLLDQLAVLLPPAGQAKSTLTIDSSWTQPQLEAAYNYLFVQGDGSLGIHNMAYTVGLLKASIADLKANGGR